MKFLSAIVVVMVVISVALLFFGGVVQAEENMVVSDIAVAAMEAEVTEAIETPEEEIIVSVETSVENNFEEVEVEVITVSEEVEETSDVQSQNEIPEFLAVPEVTIISFECDKGCVCDSIDMDAFFFTLEEMYCKCIEIDEYAGVYVVEYQDDYYLIVECHNGGRGYTPLYRGEKDGKEIFYSYGDGFVRMIVAAMEAGYEMF